jgi:hypothetical protein
MWWDVNPAGSFDGHPVSVGDRIYVTGTGRQFGDVLFGDLIFGGPPDRNWSDDQVTFTIWRSTFPPDLTDPFPYSGCPLDPVAFPGWRVVIDCLFNPADGSRTFGLDTFGSDIFGDVNGAGKLVWTDITSPSFSTVLDRGTVDGGFIVDVDRLTVDVYDDEGAWFDFAIPASYYRPTAGDTIRVGVIDPAEVYHPLGVGEIERIVDMHDEKPRLVSIEAFGFINDLANTVQGWTERGGAIQDSVARLLRAGGWRWGQPVTYPTPLGPLLLADPDGTEPYEVLVRDQLDVLAISAGWTMDTDVRGSLRFRQWPLERVTPTTNVIDCEGHGASGLLATFTLSADYDAMLNVAQMVNVADHISEDSGQAVTVHRVGMPSDVTVAGYVTGVTHLLERGRWRATVHTSTTTPTTTQEDDP